MMRWWVLGVVMACSGPEDPPPEGNGGSTPTAPTSSNTDTDTDTDTDRPAATGSTGDTGASGATGTTGGTGDTGPLDNDGDGYVAAMDCDDDDPLTYPGATPRLFIDSDCSGRVADRPSTADYVFTGLAAPERVWDVASAGDVDGDGLGDLLIAIHRTPDILGVRLYLGANLPPAPATVDFDAADYVFVARGPSAQVATGAGDLDGDGRDDIVIGIPTTGSNGEVYVFLAASLGAGPVVPLSQSDYLITGEGAPSFMGDAVASAGDVDGDGLDDLVIGAPGSQPDPGSVAVVLGGSLGATRELSFSDATYRFEGENLADRAGSAVASAGDVDGDGLGDLIIGSRFATDGSGAYRSGRAYVVRGASLSPGITSLSAADYLLEEHTAVGTGVDWSTLGTAVSSAGDIDGDGLDDLLVGAPGGAQYPFYPWEGQGVAYAVLATELSAVTTLSEVGLRFEGLPHDFAGQAVSSGDLDGDGLSDLIVGAPGDPYYAPPGAVHLFRASQINSNTLVPDFSVQTTMPASMFGAHAVALPDLDGDGRDEVLMEGDGQVYIGLSRL